MERPGILLVNARWREEVLEERPVGEEVVEGVVGVLEDLEEDHVTTVVSLDTCRGTAPRSVRPDLLVKAAAEEAGEHAISAARRDICPATVPRKETVGRPVVRTTASVTTVGREAIYQETAPRHRPIGGVEEEEEGEMSALHVDQRTISRETVPRK